MIVMFQAVASSTDRLVGEVRETMTGVPILAALPNISVAWLSGNHLSNSCRFSHNPVKIITKTDLDHIHSLDRAL